MKNVLVIAVHPDDETLGCGGTILWHRSAGDAVHWLLVTNISAATGHAPDVVNGRQAEIAKVAERYGFASIARLDFPTTKLDRMPTGDLVAGISCVMEKVKPEVVYLPNRSDVHSDHRVAFAAAISCTKNFRYPFIKRTLMYETLSETEFAPPLPENTFTPNVFIDITAHMKKKLEIMGEYAGEMKEAPFPRSVEVLESLARLRGSGIGVKYAESFMLLKEIL